jgi:hypothetical protein
MVKRLSSSECTIWEAARATSAATTFFDPIIIGSQEYVEGATGLNNPVYALLDEAESLWPDMRFRISSIVSIGTGMPKLRDFGDKAKEISTETEKTQERFYKECDQVRLVDRYFRFNVQHGLEDVGLEEHLKISAIEVATERYLELPEVEDKIMAFLTSNAPLNRT